MQSQTTKLNAYKIITKLLTDAPRKSWTSIRDHSEK